MPVFLGQYVLNIGFGETDFTSQIMDAKSTGGKIIFLFLDPKSAAMFLEQADVLFFTTWVSLPLALKSSYVRLPQCPSCSSTSLLARHWISS